MFRIVVFSLDTYSERSWGCDFFEFSAVAPFMAFVADVSWLSVVALWGGGALTAIVGFLDDHAHVAVRWRLLTHFTAAIWALSWLGGLPPLNVFGFDLDLSWFGHVCAVFYLVWMLNLYNFMDGLASIQAMSTCLGVCVIYWFAGVLSLIWLPLLLSMTVMGFLY